jgi:proline iminopeptidase
MALPVRRAGPALLLAFALVAATPARAAATDAGGRTVEIGGVRLWYRVSGRGPVCLLPTPGWGPSSELYFLSLGPLEGLFTVAYLDTRGSGRSGRPGPDAHARARRVADLEGLRRHLGAETVWLLGHSDGGDMALAYALAHPEHVAGLVLVDVSVGGNISPEERVRRMRAHRNEPWFDGAFAAFEASIRGPATAEEFRASVMGFLPFLFSSYEKLQDHAEVFRRTSLSFEAWKGHNRARASDPDLAPRLSEITAPTLVVVGADDVLCAPPASDFLHRRLPRSELLVVEKAGHFPWMEQPGAFFDGVRAFVRRRRGEDGRLPGRDRAP